MNKPRPETIANRRDGNQCVAMTDGILLGNTFKNTYLYAARTLRATDSRFQEPAGRPPPQAFTIFSLVTYAGELNDTNHNHCDHCIFANTGDKKDVTGNLIIDNTRCSPDLMASIDVAVSRFRVRTTFSSD